jgi:hypothetical protein
MKAAFASLAPHPFGKTDAMTPDPGKIRSIGTACPDARNSGQPDRVASSHAAEGGITINRGAPWQGRAR